MDQISHLLCACASLQIPVVTVHFGKCTGLGSKFHGYWPIITKALVSIIKKHTK